MLVGALQIAERGQSVLVLWVFVDDPLQIFGGFVRAAQGFENLAGLDIGRGAQRIVFRHHSIDVDGLFVLFDALVDVAQGDDGETVLRGEIEREPEVDHGGEFVALLAAGGAKAIEHFGRAFLGILDQRLERFARLDVGERRRRRLDGWEEFDRRPRRPGWLRRGRRGGP